LFPPDTLPIEGCQHRDRRHDIPHEHRRTRRLMTKLSRWSARRS